jgi:hypothetical protein
MAGLESGHIEVKEKVPTQQEVEELAYDISVMLEVPVTYLSDKLGNYMFERWRSTGPSDRQGATKDFGGDWFRTPTSKQKSADPCLSGEKNEVCFASKKTPKVLLDGYHKIEEPVWNASYSVGLYLMKPTLSGEWETWGAEKKTGYKKDLETLKKVLAENIKGNYTSYREVFDDLEKIYPILVETLGADMVKDIEKQYGVKIDPANIKMARHIVEIFLAE